jgi:hypothetical protein
MSHHAYKAWCDSIAMFPLPTGAILWTGGVTKKKKTRQGMTARFNGVRYWHESLGSFARAFKCQTSLSRMLASSKYKQVIADW